MERVSLWTRVRVWFHDSETIVWARLQILVGSIWVVLLATNLSPILPPKAITYWLIASGVITELVRRSREQRNLGVSEPADLEKVTVVVPPEKAAIVEAVVVSPAASMPAIEKVLREKI